MIFSKNIKNSYFYQQISQSSLLLAKLCETIVYYAFQWQKIHFDSQITSIKQKMAEYIGDLKQYLQVQYAKSDRSTCRKCKNHIQKNELRVGIVFDDDKFTTHNWFHLNCFQFKPRHKVIDLNQIQDHVDGLSNLAKKDQKILMKTLKNDLEELQKKEEKFENQRKNIYQAQKKQKSKKDKYPQKPLPKNEQAEERKQQAKKLIKQTKRNPRPHSYLTPSQKTQYQKLINHYQTYSVNQLKHILEKNNQAKIGRKDELAAKCADGRQFGRIPPCPKCGGGKLKLDRQKGIYYCPGYMEDTDFVHCDGRYQFGDVKRAEWIQ